MTTLEKRELAGIGIATLVLFLITDQLPIKMETGYVLVALALLFLLQSLIRDLVILSTRRKKAGKSVQGRYMCVESIVGFMPLILSILLISLGMRQEIALPGLFWPLSGMGVMLSCFVLKDLVFDLKNFRIRRDKNHINIVFKWHPH